MDDSVKLRMVTTRRGSDNSKVDTNQVTSNKGSTTTHSGRCSKPSSGTVHTEVDTEVAVTTTPAGMVDMVVTVHTPDTDKVVTDNRDTVDTAGMVNKVSKVVAHRVVVPNKTEGQPTPEESQNQRAEGRSPTSNLTNLEKVTQHAVDHNTGHVTS